MKNFSMRSSPSLAQKSDEQDEKLTTTFFGFKVNARTPRFRRFYIWLMICFPFIPIFALFAQNLSKYFEQISAYDEARDINLQVIYLIDFIN